MKKSLPLITLGVAAILFGAYFWLRMSPPLRVENFKYVHRGMTQREVEKLLGGPPGNFGRGTPGMMTMEGFDGPHGSVERNWSDDKTRFEIWFDARNVVVAFHKRASYSQTLPEERVVQV